MFPFVVLCSFLKEKVTYLCSFGTKDFSITEVIILSPSKKSDYLQKVKQKQLDWVKRTSFVTQSSLLPNLLTFRNGPSFLPATLDD